ncbi:MAG TPA: helix-turn-helix domain-containing protein, partial [Polyangiaceae bacterium]|nr:helix-turn-helix domain-containing protein [Polyangiaceae bacterium]
ERMTFQAYLRKLRIERAKQMLASTTLSAGRVGQLCGFRSRSLFHEGFKRSVGLTPHAYRQKNSQTSR